MKLTFRREDDAIEQFPNSVSLALGKLTDGLDTANIAGMICWRSRDCNPALEMVYHPIVGLNSCEDLILLENTTNIDDSNEVVASRERNTSLVLDVPENVDYSGIEGVRNEGIRESGFRSFRMSSEESESLGQARRWREAPFVEKSNRGFKFRTSLPD